MADFATMRTHMVESQILPNKVTDPRLVEALLALPRERFGPAARQGVAYVDEDLAIAPGRYLMEPAVFARLVQAVAPAPADTVLDIGCGSGYSAAVLGRLAGTVIALESDEGLRAMATETLPVLGADNVVVVEGELAEGYPDQAPYDVIVIEGGSARVPSAILDQLAEGGRLAAVVAGQHPGGRSHAGQARLFERLGGVVSSRVLFDAALPMLPGFEARQGFVF